MFKKSLVLLLVLSLVFTMFLVGCQETEKEQVPAGTETGTETGNDTEPEADPAEDNPAMARGNVLTVGTNSLDGKFNPIISDNVYDAWVVDLVFEGLATNDPAGNIIPAIAKSWDVSEDKLTYTFHLNEGVKFHDGEELTTEDVEFTYYMMASPDYTGPRGDAINDVVGVADYREGKAETIEGIKVIDPYTISFTIESKNVQKIHDFTYGIMAKHYYDLANYEDFIALNQNPMGAGPFMFKRYVVGQYCEVERFDDYWENVPKIDGVIVKLVPTETQTAEVQVGDIDLANPPANLQNAEMMTETGIANIQEFVGNGYNYLGFNLRLDKFKDKRVRQALAYGLNRKEFIQAQWEGFARVCNAPISPVSWAYTDEINEYAFDPDKARELLAEAGWIDRDNDGWVENEAGEEFEFVWTAYNDVDWPMNLIAVAKENWADIGVKMEGELMEFNAVADLVYDQQDFEMYNMGWSLSIDPDPTGIWDDDSDVLGGFNSIGFHHERANEIFKLGLEEYDQAKRAELYQEWAKIANDELGYIFIAIRSEMWGVNNRVKNLEMGPYYDWVANAKVIELDY